MKNMIAFILLITTSVAFAKSHHQIGEMGKERIVAHAEALEENEFLRTNAFARRVARATAWFTQPTHGGYGNYMGSAHLLGHFDGRFVMVTNSHLAHEKFCGEITLEFVWVEGKPKAKCKKVFYRNTQLDMALLEVEFDSEKIEFFKTVGVNIDFSSSPYRGQKLYSIGFSRHNGIRGLSRGESPRSPSVGYLTRDDHCRVLSRRSKVLRNLKKGTEIFKPTHSWSFATGCDAWDAGDCGAVYVDENNDRIVGLYWMEGMYEKDLVNQGRTHFVVDDNEGLKRVDRSESGAATLDIVPSQVVESAMANPYHKDVWKRFTYGVSAKKIGEVLGRSLLANEPDYACLFEDLLQTRRRACRR